MASLGLIGPDHVGGVPALSTQRGGDEVESL